MFPCPLRCATYKEKGGGSREDLKRHHINSKACDLNAATLQCFPCPHECRPGRGAEFSAQSLERHLQGHNDGKGMADVCTAPESQTEGRLAVSCAVQLDDQGTVLFW